VANEPVRRPRTPLSIYVVGGVLALIGAVALVRWLIGFVVSIVALVAVVALGLFLLNAMVRRGTPRPPR
jgi:hypothetical protein